MATGGTRNRCPFACPRRAAWVVCAVLLAPGLAFPQKAGTEEPSREEKAAKATFESICGSCHATNMVDDLRSEGEWKETIEQMVKSGAKGTAEQFDQVLFYLARNWTRVNVNTATAREIAPVLGVSDSVAEALVKVRTEKGSFRTLEDLKKIPGVDPAKLEARKDRISF